VAQCNESSLQTLGTRGFPVLRVLVIDDHVQFAELVSAALGEEPDLESVGYATNVAQGLDLIETVAPDLVAVNVHIGPGDGIAAIAQIIDLHPNVRVVVLTAFANELMVQRARKANARAFHPKDAGPARLLWVLRNTGHQGFTVHPEVLHRLISGGPLSSPRSASTTFPSPRAPLGDRAFGASRFAGSGGR
jgi:DNA-binding NarL/FixJ family response regulator